MSTRLEAKVRATSLWSPAFTPARSALPQRRATNQAEAATVPPIAHQVLHLPDRSLAPDTREFVEPRFGHDFSQVPAHTGAPMMLQAKLRIGQPGDRYEQEADRVADTVMRMPETHLQRQVWPEEEEEEEETLQAKTIGHTLEATPKLESRVQYLRGGGQPLPQSVRTFFEPRLGCDFGEVRIHTDAQAAETAHALNAQAFTLGQDMVFGAGRYAPSTNEGRRILAHELTHVMQQGSTRTPGIRNAPVRRPGRVATMLQRDDAEEEPSAKPEIDYRRVEKRNKFWASRLGWDKRLKTIRPGWNIMWQLSPAHFADAVVAFQIEQGFRGKQVDGVLGPRTWDRLRPVGEVVAKHKVRWTLSEQYCYEASRERMVKGYKRATGEPLVPKGERQAVRIIMKGNPSEMKKAGIDKKYWGASAAGALVYLNKGTFVSESDIWDKNALKPGAVIQVWRKKRDYDRIKRGKMPVGSGTSAVFVRYKGRNSVVVRHFGTAETWKRSKYQFWIGANWLGRETQESASEPEEH